MARVLEVFDELDRHDEMKWLGELLCEWTVQVQRLERGVGMKPKVLADEVYRRRVKSEVLKSQSHRARARCKVERPRRAVLRLEVREFFSEEIVETAPRMNLK